jgi:hypothetical protein
MFGLRRGERIVYVVAEHRWKDDGKDQQGCALETLPSVLRATYGHSEAKVPHDTRALATAADAYVDPTARPAAVVPSDGLGYWELAVATRKRPQSYSKD